jgi:hypothetical protein
MTVMMTVVAVTVTMLSFGGAERTGQQGKSEEREQCALHQESPIRANKLICRRPSS